MAELMSWVHWLLARGWQMSWLTVLLDSIGWQTGLHSLSHALDQQLGDALGAAAVHPYPARPSKFAHAAASSG